MKIQLMNRKTCLLFLAALILPFSLRLFAQPANTEVFRLKVLYDAADFSAVCENGRAMLASGKRLSPQGYAFLHEYMALAYYNIGAADSSRTHFLSLLSLRPDYELDPVEVSPKIIAFFNEIKANFSQEAPAVRSGHTRYVFVNDLRAGATWRSALLPGWGQFHKNQRTRGILLGSAFWSSLAATGFVWLNERDHRQTYVDAQIPAEISTAYEQYNKWHRARQFLQLTTAALWAATVLDANLFPYTNVPAISLDENSEALTASLQFHF